jgi:multiple sugar transport system permease protein
VVIFTLIFIGPLYFLFSDGLKSTQEAVQVPPTIVPAHVHPGSYTAAWSRVGLGRLLVNTLYYAFGALASSWSSTWRRPTRCPGCAGARQRHLRADAGHADDPGHGAGRAAVRDRRRPAAPAPEPDRLAGGDLAALGGQRLQHLPAQAVLRLDTRELLSPRPSTARPRCAPCARWCCPSPGRSSASSRSSPWWRLWKDFLWPLLVEYGYNPSRETLNVGIFEAASTTPQNLVLAASAMAAVPTLVFFLIFQRNILSGLTAGSLKG